MYMTNNTHTHTPNCRPNSAPSRTFGPLPSPCGRYWHSRVSSPMSICRMRMSLRTLDTFTRTTKCMWVAPESSPPHKTFLIHTYTQFPFSYLKELLPMPVNCPREIYDLMCECWQRNESSRPNFREIHLFLQRKNLGFKPSTQTLMY